MAASQTPASGTIGVPPGPVWSGAGAGDGPWWRPRGTDLVALAVWFGSRLSMLAIRLGALGGEHRPPPPGPVPAPPPHPPPLPPAHQTPPSHKPREPGGTGEWLARLLLLQQQQT